MTVGKTIGGGCASPSVLSLLLSRRFLIRGTSSCIVILRPSCQRLQLQFCPVFGCSSYCLPDLHLGGAFLCRRNLCHLCSFVHLRLRPAVYSGKWTGGVRPLALTWFPSLLLTPLCVMQMQLADSSLFAAWSDDDTAAEPAPWRGDFALGRTPAPAISVNWVWTLPSSPINQLVLYVIRSGLPSFVPAQSAVCEAGAAARFIGGCCVVRGHFLSVALRGIGEPRH